MTKSKTTRTFELLPDEAEKLAAFIIAHPKQRVVVTKELPLGMGENTYVESEDGTRVEITTDDISNF